MEIQVENAGLAPEEVSALISAPVEHKSAETGDRGLGTDVLNAVVTSASGVTVTAILSGLWLVWKRRRERNLEETRSATVIVRISGNRTNLETVLELSGDGRDAIHELESELSHNGDDTVHRLRITFPE